MLVSLLILIVVRDALDAIDQPGTLKLRMRPT